MANTVNIRKLIDGPRHAVFHVFFRGDGVSGELVDQVIIDPMLDFTPKMIKGQHLSLVKVWYGLAGVDVRMGFKSSAQPGMLPVWVVPAGTMSGHVNFNEFGGISDKSGIDATGRLVISTTGLVSTADQGSLIIKVSKHDDVFTMP